MELNFDKEIDVILRKAQSESSAAADGFGLSHLDADALSAFAENALPEKAKIGYMAHLANCDNCRKILSNLILLNSETESEIVHADESAIAAPVIPWYRKLFVFPNLAYSLGALTLVFGGLIVFTVLQSLNTLKNADVSQMSEKPLETKSAPAPANLNSPLSTANSTANVSQNSNTSFEADKPAMAANAMPKSTPPPGERDSTYTCEDCGSPTDEELPGNKDLNLAKDKPAATILKERAKDEVKSVDADKNNADDTKLNTERQLPSPSASGATTKEAQKKAIKKSDSETGETTRVGGKIFRRQGSAWVDSAYQSGSNMMLPSLTNVSRASNEYKNLDKDLRRIADKLGGVVIVVWKSKAYRIQ